jgi:hypothetical protein
VQGADNLDSGLDVAGGLELAQALMAGGNNLGEVFRQADGSDLLEERVQGRGRDGGAEALDECRVFLQGRIERLSDGEQVLDAPMLGTERLATWGMVDGWAPRTLLAIPRSLVQVAEFAWEELEGHVRGRHA